MEHARGRHVSYGRMPAHFELSHHPLLDAIRVEERTQPAFPSIAALELATDPSGTQFRQDKGILHGDSRQQLCWLTSGNLPARVPRHVRPWPFDKGYSCET